MDLELNNPTPEQAVTALGPDYIEINGVQHTQTMILRPGATVSYLNVHNFEQLQAEHFQQVLDSWAEVRQDRQLEVVLFGSGKRLRFPLPKWTAPLTHAGIGLETMDNGAACRTYNVLLAEDRAVAALILIEPHEAKPILNHC